MHACVRVCVCVCACVCVCVCVCVCRGIHSQSVYACSSKSIRVLLYFSCVASQISLIQDI